MADAARVNALSASLSLEGKTAIVTGASRGIGRVIAETFALAGADVAIIARNRKELEDVARVIRGNNRQAYVEVCDVSDVASVRTCVANVPVPDILVNNAGINVPQEFLDVDVDTFDKIFAIDVKGAFFVAQSVARRMRDHCRGGAIVNITSQAGHVGLIRRTVYCAAKHALEGLTRAMAIELAPEIRVNAVAPTFVETPMTKPFFEEAKFRAYVDFEHAPLGPGHDGGRSNGGALCCLPRGQIDDRSEPTARRWMDRALSFCVRYAASCAEVSVTKWMNCCKYAG